MWIFTKKGFFSIVQDKDDADYLIVRSRVKGDLENLLQHLAPDDEPPSAISEDAGSDYRYRVRALKWTIASLIHDEVNDIDYINFKAAVTVEDPRRSEYYGMVWAIMCDMQDRFLEQDDQ